MFRSNSELFEFIETGRIATINFFILDLAGRLHNLTIPAGNLDRAIFEEGLGFDGSSYGYVTVEKSDMVFIPDITSAFVDPFHENPKLNMFVKVYSLGETETRFDQDPRFIAEKVEAFAMEQGIADEIIVGPEYEFYVFDAIRYVNSVSRSMFEISSFQSAALGEIGDGARNAGYQLRNGYHAAPPADSLHGYRDELVLMMEKAGFPVKYHHHEVGGAGQIEVEVKLGRLSRLADTTVAAKYLAKNLAVKHGKTATFMPKPLFGEAGSGLHLHMMLKKDGKNVFFGKGGYSDLSDTAMYFIGGVLQHAPALLGLTNPSINSYKRLIKGYEAPVSIVFGKSNRSSAIRIPGYVTGEHDKRIEFRTQDATCNPYFGYSAIIMAGLDGIINRIDPTERGFGPYDVNVYELPPRQAKKVKSLPESLGASLAALEKDHDFLLRGGVFSKILIESWIKWVYKRQMTPMQMRPQPFEFELYYDC